MYFEGSICSSKGSRTTQGRSLTIPWTPRDTFIHFGPTRSLGIILKIGANKYFMFICNPRLASSRLYFYTYFLGGPEQAKNYHFSLEVKAVKDGPSIKRKAPVISTRVSRGDISRHSNLVVIHCSDIYEAFNVGQSNFKLHYKVQVSKND